MFGIRLVTVRSYKSNALYRWASFSSVLEALVCLLGARNLVKNHQLRCVSRWSLSGRLSSERCQPQIGPRRKLLFLLLLELPSARQSQSYEKDSRDRSHYRDNKKCRVYNQERRELSGTCRGIRAC